MSSDSESELGHSQSALEKQLHLIESNLFSRTAYDYDNYRNGSRSESSFSSRGSRGSRQKSIKSRPPPIKVA